MAKSSYQLAQNILSGVDVNPPIENIYKLLRDLGFIEMPTAPLTRAIHNSTITFFQHKSLNIHYVQIVNGDMPKTIKAIDAALRSISEEDPTILEKLRSGTEEMLDGAQKFDESTQKQTADEIKTRGLALNNPKFDRFRQNSPSKSRPHDPQKGGDQMNQVVMIPLRRLSCYIAFGSSQ